jgi:hypothetical protein
MVAFLRFLTHYSLHILFPGVIAWIFYNEKWERVYLIFLFTMVIDFDHLLSMPVFDSCRCSIGNHPLHSIYAITVYTLGLFFKRTRIISIGLLFHILTDLQDCLWIS